MVDELKAQLALQEIELEKKNQEADHLIEVVGIETKNVSCEKAAADEEKLKVDQINIDVKIKQSDCEKDLKKAEPALIAAQDALNTLNKANLTELKSFGSPPSAVLMVSGAVMVLILGQNGKIPKDRSWAKVKAMMGKVDQLNLLTRKSLTLQTFQNKVLLFLGQCINAQLITYFGNYHFWFFVTWVA